jgi:hypothetical protein
MTQKEILAKQKLQQLSIGWIITAALGGLITLFGAIWNDIWVSMLQSAFDGLPKTLLYNTILILLILLMFALSWALFLRPKNVFRKYLFDRYSGVLVKKKKSSESEEYFCTSCLLVDSIESPLKKMPDAWYCQIVSCSQKYPDPNFIRPPRKKLRMKIRGIKRGV